ncbi:hypothetical protein [Cellulomonas triticagri]|uniref:Glycosyltransferase RgtA/B/C/D-like domain-containing protein n=1 Tax=Cellulomonas triticagri TaxID=2483352 RepID=A0A3M2JPB8_9CELL|nr:hypothetical protein [Cellulomonas triticagri]RMI13720.1 hypothetical protein EBM89_03100 [Cellulomonas triticagri]
MRRADPRTWPWWVQVLAVYGVARAFSAVVLVVVAGHQAANGWTGASPGYVDYTGLMWDATWYRQIAETGYPDALPVGADGVVQQNAWAFFPLYPLLVSVVMTVTGGSWALAAPTVSLLLGAGAVLLVHRTVVVGAPRAVAARPGLPLATVLLVSVFPTSVVLQVGYTESLALLLVAVSLLAIVSRRYGWACVAVLALGFTRAVALPMAVVVAVHALVRLREWRDSGRRPPTRDLVGIGALAVTAVVSGFAWIAVVGWATGIPDAYLQTQEAWRGAATTAPFAGWTYVPAFWFGDAAPFVVLGAAVVVVACLVTPSAWRLGRELHAWSAAYLLYLAAAVEPGSSLARFLVLAFPLAAATAGLVTRPRWARWAWTGSVVVLMLVLQVVWVWQIWRIVPPSGWPP